MQIFSARRANLQTDQALNIPQLYPRISVVTVVKNGHQFIEQTIKSVLGQSYENVEYIVIDGSSTDGTVDIIRSYESRLTRWLSEPDKGIADAFNKGLALATGDYVMFLNADDALISSEVLEHIAHEIVRTGFPVLIYGDCNVLDRESDEVLYRADIAFSGKGLRRGQMLPHPSLFTHRSYFEKYVEFDVRFKMGMDYEWLLRGGLKERVVHVPLLVTSVRNGGMSTLDRARAVDEIILALKKNHLISSAWGEYRLRAYFQLRAVVKNILSGLGLYRIVDRLRKQAA